MPHGCSQPRAGCLCIIHAPRRHRRMACRRAAEGKPVASTSGGRSRSTACRCACKGFVSELPPRACRRRLSRSLGQAADRDGAGRQARVGAHAGQSTTSSCRSGPPAAARAASSAVSDLKVGVASVGQRPRLRSAALARPTCPQAPELAQRHWSRRTPAGASRHLVFSERSERAAQPRSLGRSARRRKAFALDREGTCSASNGRVGTRFGTVRRCAATCFFSRDARKEATATIHRDASRRHDDGRSTSSLCSRRTR